MTGDSLHLTPDMCNVRGDTWGGDHCLTISGPYLLQFGNEDVLKIFHKGSVT